MMETPATIDERRCVCLIDTHPTDLSPKKTLNGSRVPGHRARVRVCVCVYSITKDIHRITNGQILDANTAQALTLFDSEPMHIEKSQQMN